MSAWENASSKFNRALCIPSQGLWKRASSTWSQAGSKCWEGGNAGRRPRRGARLNVTRAIEAALASITTHHPSLGRHLRSTIRTGRYCSYSPDPRISIDWQL